MSSVNGEKSGNKIWLIPAIIFLAIGIVFGGIFGFKYITILLAERQMDNLRESVNTVSDNDKPQVVEPVEDEPSEVIPEEEVIEYKPWEECTLEEKYARYSDEYGISIPEKNIDFEALKNGTNSDIYAWIYIPELDVDDPVVQNPENDDFYLDHNLDKSAGYPGGIYTQKSYNSTDFEDRMTVIYGHNMRDNKRFSSLHRLEQQEEFEKCRYIFIYLPDDVRVYEITSAYVGSDTHILATHTWDDESWVEYLQGTLTTNGPDDSALDNYDFDKDDKALTLSTCIKNLPNNRYLVQGILLR